MPLVGGFGQRIGERTRGFNLLEIAALKTWLRTVGFPQCSMVLTRANDRNVVWIRIRVGEIASDIEAAWLDALRQERAALEQTRARILAHFDQETAVA